MNNESNCIFCSIAEGKIHSEKIFDDENFFAILDIHPKAENHTLLIPKKHYKNILEMPASLGNELVDAIKRISLELIKNKKADGINVAINTGESAGQVIHHAHVHIIPRKKGDELKSIA